jgi:hypothetical protein
VANIARGNIADAANYLEAALARAVPVAIGFLANQVGLRGIGARIAEMIGGLRDRVNAAIDWLIDRAISVGGAILQAGRNAVAAVMNWWNAKVTFTAADGHEHALYLEGDEDNQQLMIASNPIQFQTFIGNVEANNNPEKTEAKQMALDKAQEIDTEKRRRIDRSLSEEKQEIATTTKKNRIQELLQELRPLVEIFFGTDRPEGPPERLLPGTDSVGFGQSMDIKELHLTNKPSDGSTPTQAAQVEYDKLNKRRTSSGASYYIRGHLLNHNIGGPGTWPNMVPLSRQGNSTHESTVENQVKAAFDAGAVIEYSVHPSPQKFNGGASSIKAEIDSSDDDAQSKVDKKQIVDTEANVPQTLIIKAYTLRKNANNQFERDHTIVDLTVTNPVERTNNSYFVSRSGEPIVYLNYDNDHDRIMRTTGLNANQVTLMLEERASRGQQFGQYSTFLRASGLPETDIETRASSLSSNPRVSLGAPRE